MSELSEIGTQTVPEETPVLPADESDAAENLQETEDLTPEETELPPEAAQPDYAALAEEDLREIQRIAPVFGGITHLSHLPNAARYAALRDAGLTVEEALFATCHELLAPKRPAYDNRSHLQSAVPRAAAGNPAMMSAQEMAAAKELFGDLSDAEIQKLYAKCRT